MHVSEIQALPSTFVNLIRPCPQNHEDPNESPDTNTVRACEYPGTFVTNKEDICGVSNEITLVKLASVQPAVKTTARLVR
jgi:hypothetical protein